jgi:hypothetical protein
MKKFVIKIFLAVALIIVTVLILAALFSLHSGSKPTFNFLSGQKSLYNVKKNSYKTDFYSFKADVNSIHAKAKAELTSLGYTERIPDVNNSFFKFREWTLPHNSVCVRIIDKQRIKVFKDPKTSQYSSPDRYWEYYEDSWITVEVRQVYHNFWWWFYTIINKIQ